MWQPRRLTPEQLEERRLEAGRLLRAGPLSQAGSIGVVAASKANAMPVAPFSKPGSADQAGLPAASACHAS
jgi:hypothetical protein